MASTRNGSTKLLFWIASGLATALLAWAGFWMAGISDHGERIRANEIVNETIQEDVAEIKADVKSINGKLDRALRRGD